MTSNRTPLFAFAVLALTAPLLSGCIVAAGGAAATVGVAAAQERSVGAALDDNIIGIRIRDNWASYSRELSRRLDMTVTEGRVLVTGIVPTEDDRVDAIRLAWQVKGVREVLNEVQVDREERSLGEAAEDRWITTQLRTLLTTDRDIASINYSIETVRGVVYLMGIASSQAELDAVTDHARRLGGVKRVVSYVRLMSQDGG